MARFHPGPLGKPIGKSGNIVFRTVNGKLFISVRPKKYKVSYSAEAKASRKAFSLVVQFTKIIISDQRLKECWKTSGMEGTSAYHKIIKANLPRTSGGSLTRNNLMTPEGFGFTLLSEFTRDRLLLTMELNEKENRKNLSSIDLLCIFCFSAPENANTPYSQITDHRQTFQNLPDNNYTLNAAIEFSAAEKKLLDAHKKLVTYIILIKTYYNGKYECSCTKVVEYDMT